MQNIELLMETYTDFVNTTEAYTSALLPDGNIHKMFPNFHMRLSYARSQAMVAQRRRNQMPVIEDDHITDLKAVLTESGYLSWCDDCLVAPLKMKPIQCTIHVDKCIGSTIEHGIEDTLKFLTSQHVFLDNDNNILDGHHRWFTGILLDWNLPLPAFKIRANAYDLMPLLLAFSDKYNERNL